MIGTNHIRFRAWVVTLLVTAVTLVACEMKNSSVETDFRPISVDLKTFRFETTPAFADPHSAEEMNRFIVRAVPPAGTSGHVALYRADNYDENQSDDKNTVWIKVAETRNANTALEDRAAVGGKKYGYRLQGVSTENRVVDHTFEIRIPLDIWAGPGFAIPVFGRESRELYSRVVLDGASLRIGDNASEIEVESLKVLRDSRVEMDRRDGFPQHVNFHIKRASGNLLWLSDSKSCPTELEVRVDQNDGFNLEVRRELEDTPAANLHLSFGPGVRNDNLVYWSGEKTRVLDVAGMYRFVKEKGGYLLVDPSSGHIVRLNETAEEVPPTRDSYARHIKRTGDVLEVTSGHSDVGLGKLVVQYQRIKADDEVGPNAMLARSFYDHIVRLGKSLSPGGPKLTLDSSLEKLYSNRAAPILGAVAALERLLAVIAANPTDFEKYWSRHGIKRLHISSQDIGATDPTTWFLNPDVPIKSEDLLSGVRGDRPLEFLQGTPKK